MEVKHKLQTATMVGGAASAIVLPQAIINTWPELFASVAPLAITALPACTGTCGACGGSCLTSVSALLWLGCCKYIKKPNEEDNK